MLAGQLTFDDEDRAGREVAATFERSLLRVGGLERLGDSDAFARELVAIVERHDWTVLREEGFEEPAEITAFAGGVLLVASRGWLEIRGRGDTYAEAAGQLLQQAAIWTPALRGVTV